MLNQGQGTYPQLAGSFYNSAQMMPHDNGRNAQQVPTFFTGLQNMMGASTAMNSYQGMPLSQNILSTQALATNSYNSSLPGLIGGLGTGLSVAGGVGSLGMMLGVGGGIASSLAAPPLLLASLAAGGVASAYKKRMAVVEDMRNALQGSRLGYGLADPITGTISNTAAFNLSDQLKYSAAGSGFQGKDLTKVLGQASGLGMLNGMQSLGEVTKKVTDLAKASREIVMLGEGISMTDAMQLQKLTQDMGISTSKFRGKNLGKNLVMAARAAGMSLDEAAQVGGQGAITFQQLGLGAASGMNAAFFSNIAAKGLTGVGAFSGRQLSALGGEQGIAQNLLAGQASTMARMSDTLVMGSVKLAADGQFRIDRDLLDRYVRGEVSAKDLVTRGKDIGKGMSKGQRSKLLESLQYQMPELKEQMTDMLSSEEMMTIQGREILELKKKSGLSMRSATQAYFGDAAQAETFLGYAQNYRAARAEGDRQDSIAKQERMLKYAGMSKSSSLVSRAGRSIVHGMESIGDAIMSPLDSAGAYLAEQTVRYQDDQARGLRKILGVGNIYSQAQIGDIGATVYAGSGSGRSLLSYSAKGVLGGTTTRGSAVDLTKSILEGGSEFSASRRVDMLLDKLKLSGGLNVAGGGGLGQRLTEFDEGEYSAIFKIGDYLGIEDSTSNTIRKLKRMSHVADEAEQMGRAQNNRGFDMRDREMRSGYATVIEHLRRTSLAAAKGDGSGAYGGVNSAEIGINRLGALLAEQNITGDKAEAIIGQAYRGFSKMGGEVGKGFNTMMLRYANIAGAFDVSAQPAKLDTISLSGGGSIQSTGLSRALSESKLSANQGDVQKLVDVISNAEAYGLDIGDGGRDSIEAIMAMAGLSRERYSGRDRASVRNVVSKLLGAQYTTKKDSEGKSKTFSLKDSFTQGITSIRLGGGTVSSTAQLDAMERINALNTRLIGIYGEGAGHLVEDLQGSISLGTSERDREKMYASTFDSQLEQRGNPLGLQYHRDVQDEHRRLLDSRANQSKQIRQEIAKTKKHLDAAGNSVVKDQMSKQLVGLEDKLKSLTDQDTLQLARKNVKEGMFQQYKTSTDFKTVQKLYEEENASLLSLGRGTLSETLEELAQRGGKDASDKAKRSKAYAKIMQGPLGTELESEFRNMRSRLTGVTDQAEKQRVEAEFRDKIIKKAAANNIELPGMKKSKNLNQVLTSISEGIDSFKQAMQSIASLKNENGELVIKLPPAN